MFPEGFGIWDAHTHLGRANATPAKHAADLLRTGKRLGIEKINIAMGLTPHLANPTPEQFREKNNDLIRALDAHPEHTLGILYVNPLFVKESLAEIDRCMVHRQIVGIKLWIACRCHDARLDPIVERVARYRGTIHQHVWDKSVPNGEGESYPENLAELAGRHPDVKFIAMHSGGNWERGIRALRAAKNVSAEISGSEPVSGFVQMAVRELGDRRIIWGSDAGGRSFASQLAKVYDADLPPKSRERIFRDNFRQPAERALAYKKR
ncbi:MAG: putative TIM-barrel fold metal-dependent hydrolase [Limisphaerales bacterium]